MFKGQWHFSNLFYLFMALASSMLFSLTALASKGKQISVSVSPTSVTLQVSQSQQFTASVSGGKNQSVTWSVSPAIGSISSAGLYRPPSYEASNQQITIIATSAGVKGSAIATILAGGIAPVPSPSASPSPNPSPTPSPSPAPTPGSLAQRTLVVYNAQDASSLSVAQYYAAARNIPSSNLCAINLSSISGATTSYIPGSSIAAYENLIKTCLNAVGASNILYIVFTYNTPYTVYPAVTGGYSLDSFISNIWSTPAGSYVSNPYFVNDNATVGGSYAAFTDLSSYRSKGGQLIYSVFRIDGPTPAIAERLVDLALQAEANGLDGNGCFDQQYGPVSSLSYSGSSVGDFWIFQSYQFAQALGFASIDDTTTSEIGFSPAAPRCDNAAFYAGWYSYGDYNDVYTYRPGAIVEHYDSLSTGSPRTPGTWSPSAVNRGAAVTTGAVAEPYLTGLARSDTYLNAILNYGANVGDAILRATPWLDWQIINMGDPLYRPYPTKNAPSNPVPAKLVLSAAVTVPAQLCIAVDVISKDANNFRAPVSQSIAITLSGTGLGSFYSDSSCTQPTSQATIAAGASASTIYFMDGASENVTLNAASSALGQSSTSVVVHSPVLIYSYMSAPTHGTCVSQSVSFMDANNFYEVVPHDVQLSLSSTGSGQYYADSACTIPISNVTMKGGTIYRYGLTVYFMDPVAEPISLGISDPSGPAMASYSQSLSVN